MSAARENGLGTDSQLNLDVRMEGEAEEIYVWKYTVRKWTWTAMGLKAVFYALGILMFGVALIVTAQQERKPSFVPSESRGPVTDTVKGVGLGLSLPLTLLFIVGLHGVLNQNLGLIRFSILLLSLSVLGDVGLFIILCIWGGFKTAAPLLLWLGFGVFSMIAATVFYQQVNAETQSQHQNQNLNQCTMGNGVQTAAGEMEMQKQ